MKRRWSARRVHHGVAEQRRHGCQNPLDEETAGGAFSPEGFRRQITARLSGRSAALLSGAMPGTRVKVQSALPKLSRFRQVLSVF